MTIHVPDPLVAGASVIISISSSTRSNLDVTVTVTDGTGESMTILIHLDDSGSGSAPWIVPDWSQAYFNDGVCAQVHRDIVEEAQASG